MVTKMNIPLINQIIFKKRMNLKILINLRLLYLIKISFYYDIEKANAIL